jgi:hypothetical protein
MKNLKLVLLTILSVLCGCPEQTIQTEILVVVDADPAVKEQLKTLRVELLDPTEKSSVLAAKTNQEFDLTKTPLPLSYSLWPADGWELGKQFRVVAMGKGLGSNGKTATLIESQKIVRFVKGERRLLTFSLTSSCLNQLCYSNGARSSEQSCGASGQCAGIETATLEPATLDSFGGYKVSVGDAGKGASKAPEMSEQKCEVASDCMKLIESAQPAGCATVSCKSGKCELGSVDKDGDMHGMRCRVKTSKMSLGDDCDDDNPAIHPKAWDGPKGPTDDHPDACD